MRESAIKFLFRAILLFDKQRNLVFPDAWIQCGRFIGTDKSNILDHRELYDPLPLAIDSIILFLKNMLYEELIFQRLGEKMYGASLCLFYAKQSLMHLFTQIIPKVAHLFASPFLMTTLKLEIPAFSFPGLTIEDMKQGISKIRNHVIAPVFLELNLSEQWGSGVYRIFEEAKKQCLPEPKIIEIGMRIRIIISLAHTITPLIPNNIGRARLESKFAARVLMALQNREISKAQIAQSLGHKTISGELNKQIKQLLTFEMIELTLPDKPNNIFKNIR